METVISNDGTALAVERVGSGAPLVLVHGTTGSRGRWGATLPMLAANYTVCDMDRRGRGDSGDAEAYAIEREAEDIEAVVASCDGQVSLFGHSFGGICALEAALLTDRVEKLILYEPPVAAPDTPAARATNARLEVLLAGGDREAVLTAFLRDNVGIPEAALEQMREGPSWKLRVATAHTIPREVRAVMAYQVQAERFAAWDIPVLLLAGSDSPAVFVESTRMLEAALPRSTVVELPGQRHAAINTAPELVVEAVRSFLRG